MSNDEATDFVQRNRELQAQYDQLYPLIGSSKHPVLRIPEVVAKYSAVEHSPNPFTPLIQVHGRIQSIRRSGKGLIFIDLIEDSTKIQIVLNAKRLDIDPEKFRNHHALLRRGDIIGIEGQAWRTKSGQLSVLASQSVRLLAPCLHPLPINQLSEVTRSHNRVVDLLVNERAKQILQCRATIIRYIRDFFYSRGFLEVQTPVLSGQAGGATARPFTTQSNALDTDGKTLELALRIAPELWLKRLVIGGVEKVFEIGQCFRNEGIDATHNPEFTTCEFYQSYANLDDLIHLTETLLQGLLRELQQQCMDTAFHDHISALTTSFVTFKKIDFISCLEAKTGVPLPTDLSDTDELLLYYDQILMDKPPTPQSASKLLDALAAKYIEPDCSVPTFIINHPKVMAPLAKSTVTTINGRPREVSRRFELFIENKEFVNAYEEENSPSIQANNLQLQSKDRLDFKDVEAPVPDLGYIEALEWGLPPTGGWGMGIDRLCMLITGTARIDQVMSFGGLKVVNYQ